MTAEKCVVEGCNLEYDVVCSFSFYNVNTQEEGDAARTEWISGAMREEGECLWRHVSLHLCGYHFELDSQGLWIDSPMLPELLTPQAGTSSSSRQPTEDDAKGAAKPPSSKDSYQGLFAKFVGGDRKAAEVIKTEHNYSSTPPAPEPVSRLNVRQLVDTLGYLSLKNLQRKQLWVVSVAAERGEASITQAEQCIQKLPEPKQIIEIIPQTAEQSNSTIEINESDLQDVSAVSEDMPVIEEQVTDNFIYEIAEEQEIAMEEVKEISPPQEWLVNIVPNQNKSKYAFIKHCNTGKKKRHFTADMNEMTVQGDFDNYYILPDADPSLGVEVTTSGEPDTFIVGDYQMVLEERPRKRTKEPKSGEPKKRKKKTVREQVKQIKTDINNDWVIDNNVTFDQDESDDYDPKNKSRSRRKSKKYDYDFVT